jgi:hypothetical protein
MTQPNNDSAISVGLNAVDSSSRAATPIPSFPCSDKRRQSDEAPLDDVQTHSKSPDIVSIDTTDAVAPQEPSSPQNHQPQNSTFPYNMNSNGTAESDAAPPFAAYAINAEAQDQAQNGIELDGDFDDGSDAGYETDSVGSASTSLASSVRDYAFENGRRYHKFREGAYNFPNDDTEQDREDMKHACMVNLCGVLHLAPIGPNPQNILDMGTGLFCSNLKGRC